MTPLLPVYVISLARAKERRAQIAEEFGRVGLAYEIFDGTDGQMEYDRLLAKADVTAWRANMGAPISSGHLGCYASHVALWKKIGDGSDEIALICEDDVALKDDFLKALESGLKISENWDILRFAKIRAKLAIPQGKINGYSLNAYAGPFTGNACYLIKRDLAARLAQNFWPIQRAHDHELNRFFDYDFRLLGLEPFAAHPEDCGESYITGTAMSGARKFKWYRRLRYYRQKAANYLRRVMWLAKKGMLIPNRNELGRD